MSPTTRNQTPRAVLELKRSNTVGLFERACSFVTERDGNIIKSGVHVFGGLAFVLLYFEALTERLERMENDVHGLEKSTESTVVLTRTSGEDQGLVAQPIRIHTPDFPGLLADQLKLFVKHRLDVLSHEGGQCVLPHPGNPKEYVQRLTVAKPKDPKAWDSFTKELEQLIYGSKNTEGDETERANKRAKDFWTPQPRLAYN